MSINLSEKNDAELAAILLPIAEMATFVLPYDQYNINGVAVVLVKDSNGWGIKCDGFRLIEGGEWSKKKLWRWGKAQYALAALEDVISSTGGIS